MKLEFPKDLLSRETYLDQVMPFIQHPLIKVFTGQRRVGKSYLLFQVIRKILALDKKANIIYVNFEDIQFLSMKEPIDLVSHVKKLSKKSAMNYVFIDEIQELNQFEIALRSLLLDENIDLYCTGSNANLLSTDIAGKLSGRVIEIKVYSLSYLEFLNFHQLENDDNALDKYLKFGGLPYLKNLKLEEQIVFEYLKNIYNSIAYRDIINRFEVRNVNFLERLVLFLANETGSLFSAKKISDFLKSQFHSVPSSLVQQYANYLVNAFLVHKIQRYDIKGKKIFEVGEKYYFENLGLRHSIAGYKLDDLGKIAENAVCNHLLFLGYEVKIGVIGKQEVDFVAKKNNEMRYVQVALSIVEPSTFQREFGNLQMIHDNFRKEVVTLNQFNGNTVDGIFHSSLRTFLSSTI